MRVGGRGLGENMGYHEKQQRRLLTFTYKLSQESNRCFAATQTHLRSILIRMEIPCFLACLLAGHQNCTLSATKPLAHSKIDRKNERTQISLCMPTPYTTTHVAMLLEEHVTFLFPSSENEGFSQEFQSLGAQANS